MMTARRGTKARTRWQTLVCALTLLAGCLQEPLTADPRAELPAPRHLRHSTSITTYAPGIKDPLRVALEARVPAELGDVLAFYRRELGKRGWQERPEDAVIAADRVQLAFASSKGPATLTLARARGETSISLAQGNKEVAAKADILPTPGQARLIFGYLVPDVASLTINDRTIKIPGGENHPQTLDLPPGTYSYQLLVSGHPVRTNTITVASGEAWSLRLGDDGDKGAEQIY